MRGLVRTQNGMMIHSQNCHMAKRGAAVPWRWAEKVSARELMTAVMQFGYRQCRRCQPLAVIAREAVRR